MIRVVVVPVVHQAVVHRQAQVPVVRLRAVVLFRPVLQVRHHQVRAIHLPVPVVRLHLLEVQVHQVAPVPALGLPVQAVPVHLQVRVLAVHRPVRVVALVAVYHPRPRPVVQVVLLLLVQAVHHLVVQVHGRLQAVVVLQVQVPA